MLETLRREREHLGPDHKFTVATTSVLAQVSFQLGDYAASEELYEQLVEAHTRLRGADAPATLFCTVWRGICVLEQGRAAEAEALFNQLRARSPESTQPKGLTALLDAARAKYLWTQRDFEQAETLLIRSQLTLNQEYGPRSGVTRLSTFYLTQLYAAWDKPEAVAAWETKLDP